MVVDAGKKGGSRILITLDLPNERVNHVQPSPRTWKPTGRRKRDAERREAWLCRRRREAWLKRRGECGELAGTPAYPLVAPASHPVITTTGHSSTGAELGTGEEERAASSKDAVADDRESNGTGKMTSPPVPRSGRRPLSTSPIPQVDGINADSDNNSESEEDDDRSTSFCRSRHRRRNYGTEEEDSGADSDAVPWRVYRPHQLMSQKDNQSATPHLNSAGKRRPTRLRP